MARAHRMIEVCKVGCGRLEAGLGRSSPVEQDCVFVLACGQVCRSASARWCGRLGGLRPSID
ncbi:hypothetical protein LOAG_00958 [Loa loa]|uniref:Uncharacterized protein n=1 Tax=Loa loa TaxID=7209 RepID=A0A1S0UA16_LOALO|nr:hypothetical protein LOAG_00958 [Loa loa]EFO27528.1 hypothetical protein LOAG_00958 [Loa loa]